jgi:hypothetical protein
LVVRFDPEGSKVIHFFLAVFLAAAFLAGAFFAAAFLAMVLS